MSVGRSARRVYLACLSTGTVRLFCVLVVFCFVFVLSFFYVSVQVSALCFFVVVPHVYVFLLMLLSYCARDSCGFVCAWGLALVIGVSGWGVGV